MHPVPRARPTAGRLQRPVAWSSSPPPWIQKLRAWAGELPYAGLATPMTYEAGERQYVVIAAGGHGGWGLRVGDAVMAFALP